MGGNNKGASGAPPQTNKETKIERRARLRQEKETANARTGAGAGLAAGGGGSNVSDVSEQQQAPKRARID